MSGVIPSPTSLGLHRLGLEFSVVLVRWLPALLLLLIGVGRGVCDGSGGGAGETEAPSFCVDPWRIKFALVGSGVLLSALVLDESLFDPSLFFVGTGTVAGFSGGILGRYVFQLVKSGWSFAPTIFWWFASPLGWSVGRRGGVVGG
jgi:hypothetical protein